MTHRALDVAHWFLAHNRMVAAEGDAENISNLKLQKLLYYAQGTFLAVHNGEPLFDDPILAWKHGPVIPAIYHIFKTFGSNGIEFDEQFDPSTFTREEDELLCQVYEQFGQFSAWKLREMTHEENPWKESAQNAIIPNEKIQRYFEEHYIA